MKSLAAFWGCSYDAPRRAAQWKRIHPQITTYKAIASARARFVVNCCGASQSGSLYFIVSTAVWPQRAPRIGHSATLECWKCFNLGGAATARHMSRPLCRNISRRECAIADRSFVVVGIGNQRSLRRDDCGLAERRGYAAKTMRRANNTHIHVARDCLRTSRDCARFPQHSHHAHLTGRRGATSITSPFSDSLWFGFWVVFVYIIYYIHGIFSRVPRTQLTYRETTAQNDRYRTQGPVWCTRECAGWSSDEECGVCVCVRQVRVTSWQVDISYFLGCSKGANNLSSRWMCFFLVIS